MPILKRDKSRCVLCGNCSLYLGDDLIKRFVNNEMVLTNKEAKELRGMIQKALDKCHLDALMFL